MSTFVYGKPIQKKWYVKMRGRNYVVQTRAWSKSVWEFEAKFLLESFNSTFIRPVKTDL